MKRVYDVTWFLAASPHLKVVVRVEQEDENWADSQGNMHRAYQTAANRYSEWFGQEPPDNPAGFSIVRAADQEAPHWSWALPFEGKRAGAGAEGGGQ